MSDALLPDPIRAEDLVARRRDLQARGGTLVLTNGCFDLLHAGHLYALQEAARLGSELWVAVNADESVRALKGPDRPLQEERARAYALSRIRGVAAVFVFPGTRLHEEIRRLAPDLYAKSGDYSLDTLDPGEREALEEVGAKIHFLPFLEGFSTRSFAARAVPPAPTA
jgi:rfaE bifunctional protein nucleotidyltransferase chain/domain